MENSYLSQYSEPNIKSSYPIANMNAMNTQIRVKDYRSFSSIYVGGQTVNTSKDLLKFMKV